MRHLTFGLLAVLLHLSSSAQNVGIGLTTGISARLHVAKPDSGLLVLQNTRTFADSVKVRLYFKTEDNYTGAIGTHVEKGSSTQARLGLFTYAYNNPDSLRERLSIRDNGNVGIGTTSPSALLDVNGSFRLRGNGAAAGRALIADASGLAAWSGPVAFCTVRSLTALVAPAQVVQPGVYDITEYETNAGSLSYGPMTFTAPVAGYYHVSGSLQLTSAATSNHFTILVSLSNGYAREFEYREGVLNDQSFPFSCDVRLAAGEGLRVIFTNSNTGSNAITIEAGSVHNFLTGHLIR